MKVQHQKNNLHYKKKDLHFPIETNGKNPDKSSDKPKEGKYSHNYSEYIAE